MKVNQQTRRRGADPAMPRLLGERLCLDFANTVESPKGEHPEEFLHGYADLVRWGRHVGLLDDMQVARLLETAAARPDEAAGVFERAMALRAALTGVFRVIATRREPAETDLKLLQAEYLTALRQARLTPDGDGFDWRWEDDAALDRPLWPVARSAIELLSHDELKRVKECPGAGDCGWLFYDTSKNASRRWCSMEGCGSRVKMRHQYARKRGGRGD